MLKIRAKWTIRGRDLPPFQITEGSYAGIITTLKVIYSQSTSLLKPLVMHIMHNANDITSNPLVISTSTEEGG
jgi:hypothetical protein